MPVRQAADEVQLATRFPKPLHQAIKLYCVKSETSMAEFVAAAIREKLKRSGRR